MVDTIDAIERLVKLKADGALSETEFQAAKQKLLQGHSDPPRSGRKPSPSQKDISSQQIVTDTSQIPWFRRPLPFILFYLLLQPVALLIMLTGPNYFWTKGGYWRWGRGLKIFFFIIGLVGILFGLALTVGDTPKDTASPKAAAQSDSSGSAPQMRVSANPAGIAVIIAVTSDDDSPFSVNRIVTNGRPGEEGCDSTLKNNVAAPVPPKTLKRGDATAFVSVCGNSVLKADVFTDRGNSTFKFGPDSN